MQVQLSSPIHSPLCVPDTLVCKKHIIEGKEEEESGFLLEIA